MSFEQELKVLCCTANIGNTLFKDLGSWVPQGGFEPDGSGRQYDVIAIGMQESVFAVNADEQVDLDTVLNQEGGLTSAGAHLLDASGIMNEPEPASPLERRQSRRETKKIRADVKQINTKSEGGWGSMFLDQLNSKCSTHIAKVIETQLGQDYALVGKGVKRMQMRLRVYALKKHNIKARDVETDAHNTGLGKGPFKLANKGGQVLAFKVAGMSLCFVNSHLAAHEGGKHLKERNDSVAAIMEGVRVGERTLDFGSQFHHAFFFGDMNYRINMKKLEPEASLDEDHGKEWARVKELVDDSGSSDPVKAKAAQELLWRADELMHLSTGIDDPATNCVTLTGDVLCGWKTLKPKFKPTFKVVREKSLEYVTKRIPSYCDRVLWKSLPGLAKDVTPIVYDAATDFLTSDHKPVRCGFTINTASVRKAPPRNTNKTLSSGMEITFSQLSCSDMKYDMFDIPDAYLQFHSEPQLLVATRKGRNGFPLCCSQRAFSHVPRTKTINNSRNPNWGDSTVTGTLNITQQQLADPAVRNAVHIIIGAMDYDDASADDLLGSVAFSLGEIYDAVGTRTEWTFDRPLICHGRVHGAIKGCIKLGEMG